MACLSSRIPYGEPVTEAKLKMIEEAENILRDLGFYDVRVRHHELSGRRVEGRGASLDGPPLIAATHLARIEVGPAELSKFLENGLTTKIAGSLKRIGYRHVTLDLQGYRRGSPNESLNASQRSSDS